MLSKVSSKCLLLEGANEVSNLRLTFKVFHDVQETIVYIWLVGKLNLDLIKIA
jgi:hypothetical protein